jgi:hypothetical protein
MKITNITRLAAACTAFLGTGVNAFETTGFDGFRFKPLIGISSTMLETQESDRYVGDIKDAYDPLSNVTGVDIGFTLLSSDYPFVFSAKTNRLAQVTNIKEGTLYFNGVAMGDAQVTRTTTTDSIILSWLPPWLEQFPVVPYLSYNRNEADSIVKVAGIEVKDQLVDNYWGPGFAIPLDKEFNSGMTFTVILQNNDAGTEPGFNLSIYKSFQGFDF